MIDSNGRLDGHVLIVAFEGWNDAGEAASCAARMISDQLQLVPHSEVDPELYFDFNFNRPVLTDRDGERKLVWPAVHVLAPRDAGNIFVLSGSEPSRNWRTFCQETIETLLTVDIDAVVFLGAMLADVPHSRPISVVTSSENEDTRLQFSLERSTYEGPVGILSALAEAAEAVGLATLSIWASVPHYVHNSPSPKATLALIEELERFVDITIDRKNLATEAATWEEGINALAADDDDMATYIAQLESARDAVDSPEASGEAIAQEFQRYLNTREDPESSED